MEPESSSKEAERHGEISIEFLSSEKPNSGTDNHPGISRTQLSFEKKNVETNLASVKNDMEGGVLSGTKSIEDEVLSGKNNMEDEVLSGKNNIEDEVISGKNNMENEVISGKNNMEDEDQIEASSKPEPPRKKTTKKMRASRKIVKKSEQAESNAEILSKLQSSEEPNSEADNHPGISRTQQSFEKNNVEADLSSAKNDMETDLASVKNDMEGGVFSGTKSMEDEVLSGKNMENEILSGMNSIEDEVISGKNNMEDEDQIEASSKLEPPKKKTTTKLRARRKIVKKSEQTGGSAEIFSKLKSSEEPSGEAMNPPKDSTKQPSFGKNNTDTEGLPGKNNIMAENQGQAVSKLESSSKRITKKLRARRKIVKKCVEAGGSAETFSKLQSSAAPGDKAVNPPKASTKQLSLGNNDMETEVLPGKNSMEAANQGEASTKPESSTKITSKMLKARPKILKKSLANESLKENMANGTSKVQQRNRRKNKKLSAREETTDKNVTNKVRNEGNLEIRNRERVRWSDKSWQNQRTEGKHSGSDETSRQKNKEKWYDIEKSQQNEIKRDKIGGLIFMCSAKTKPDCFHYRVMGLSMNKKDLVLSIKPGLKLFLYDFDLKLLYGIYKASSPGSLNIEHRAFGGAFPVQVRFDIHKDCFPLPESVFKKAIKENYNEKRKFNTELTAKQVRKLSELFRTLPGGPGHSPAMPVVRGRESYARVKELRPHASRERVHRDPYIDDNDRNYPILPRDSRERREHIAYKEIMPQQREEISREMYLSEKDYRAYGLQGERRKLTPLRHVSPLRHAALILDPYQRDHAREHLIRQPDLTYRDTVNIHRESSRTDPFYLTEREYPAYNLGAKLDLPSAALPVHPAASVTVTGPVLDHYKRDPYYPYHYGASSVDSYQLPARRDEVSSGTYSTSGRIETYPGDPVSSGTYSTSGRIETYPGEMDRFHRREPEQVGRLYSTYATDALSNYNRISHSQGDAPETAPVPVSSRYSFAGPSLSYR